MPDLWCGDFILHSETSYTDFEVSIQSTNENKYE